MSGFDWRGLMAAGLAAGLRPVEFWALTPAEFLCLTGREGAGAMMPMTRAGLDRLEAAFPDLKGVERNG